MAIRVTVVYSGYIAQNLVACVTSKATTNAVNCRFLHECVASRSRFKPDPSYSPEFRYLPKPPKPKTPSCRFSSSSENSTIAGEIFGGQTQSPLIVGVISLMKTTTSSSSTSSPSCMMGAFGIFPLKPGAIIPFLQASKWLPCSQPSIGSTSTLVDNGGTVVAESNI